VSTWRYVCPLTLAGLQFVIVCQNMDRLSEFGWHRKCYPASWSLSSLRRCSVFLVFLHLRARKRRSNNSGLA
jgi:hypothetical protein